jgi:hypothetical protein
MEVTLQCTGRVGLCIGESSVSRLNLTSQVSASDESVCQTMPMCSMLVSRYEESEGAVYLGDRVCIVGAELSC